MENMFFHCTDDILWLLNKNCFSFPTDEVKGAINWIFHPFGSWLRIRFLRLLTFLFVNGVDLHGMKCSILLILILFNNVDFHCNFNARLYWSSSHEMLDYIDGHGEDDGGVMLRRNGGEGLQVSAIKARWIIFMMTIES